jgi:hypothetical protein
VLDFVNFSLSRVPLGAPIGDFGYYHPFAIAMRHDIKVSPASGSAFVRLQNAALQVGLVGKPFGVIRELLLNRGMTKSFNHGIYPCPFIAMARHAINLVFCYKLIGRRLCQSVPCSYACAT